MYEYPTKVELGWGQDTRQLPPCRHYHRGGRASPGVAMVSENDGILTRQGVTYDCGREGVDQAERRARKVV